jgi:hypothetical protein
VVAMLVGCAQSVESQTTSTCEATGDLLRVMARGFAADLSEEEVSTAVDRVVTAADSSESYALRDPAQRLSTAWDRSGTDGEAAPNEAFGRALNDLANTCVEHGFAYPDVGLE